MGKDSKTWKAVCVESHDSWMPGDVVEVVNGTMLCSERHRWGGSKGEEVKTFDNWCNFHSDSKWELIEDEKEMSISDSINPTHYNSTKISAFDVIDDWGLNFYTGNVVKYIQRAGKKENNSELQDLKKAQRYLEKQIELLEVGKML